MCAPSENGEALLKLDEISASLQGSLASMDSTPADEGSIGDKLMQMHESEVAAKLPKIWSPNVEAEERIAAIQSLALSLDKAEELVVGPMLTGKQLSIADAVWFPSLAALEMTLPQHFGWEEWTDEALWWRRPRLHGALSTPRSRTPCAYLAFSSSCSCSCSSCYS